MSDFEPLLKYKEVTKILRVSRAKLYQLRESGDLKSTKDKPYRFRPQDVRAYLDRQFAEPTLEERMGDEI